MNLELENRHVMVTGGSRGIGLACVRAFLGEKCKITIVARDPARLAAVRTELEKSGIGVATYAQDLTDAEAALGLVERVEAEHGPVEVLVNSAGDPPRRGHAELRPADWLAAMEAKFLTCVNVAEPMLKRMAERRRGVVVNVIGLGGKVPAPGNLPGGAANAALMLATAGWASAWASHGIRVNGVSPTMTDTDLFQDLVAAEAKRRDMQPEQVLAEKVAGMPMRRAARPEEIADAVVFLASARASYISGAILSVDGASKAMIV